MYTVKFSPNGRFIATVTQEFFRIYASRDGSLVVNVPIEVPPLLNHFFAWSSNSRHLFAVSFGKIICLDASTGATFSQWSIHGDKYNRIALASNGVFIAASSGSSVSFWDATTYKQIGPVIEHTADVNRDLDVWRRFLELGVGLDQVPTLKEGLGRRMPALSGARTKICTRSFLPMRTSPPDNYNV